MRILPAVCTKQGKDSSSSTVSTRVAMHVLGKGSTDVRVMRAATALANAGCSVSVIDVESEPGCPEREDIRDIHMIHIVTPSWFTSRRRELWFFTTAIWVFFLSIWRLLQTKADVYHAHDVNALLACYVVATLRHKPLIFEAHELPPAKTSITFWRQMQGVIKRLLALFLPTCAGVITVSPPIAYYIQERYHVPKVTLARNVPEYKVIEKRKRLHQVLNLETHVSIALYQGNIQPNRSLDRLVRAARFLEPNIVIVMMGRAIGNTRNELEALAVLEGVTKRVKILPPVPYTELLEWTASADIGLNIFSPDYSESIRWCLPNKLFEYLMAGLPVITSELEAVVDIVIKLGVGQVVSSLEPEDVANAINGMLADLARLTQMSQRALSAAREEFCWEKEQQNLIQLYQEIGALEV